MFFILGMLFHFSVGSAMSQEKTEILQLRFSEENGAKFVTAKANEFMNDSIGDPIKGIDLLFFVERTFSLLPFGNRFNTTDENGEVTMEFPSDLPGDSVGNLTVIVKIEDAETEIREMIDWGIAVEIDQNIEKRSLWAAGANAPISLLLLTNIMIAAAWGTIIYIVFSFYQISKM